MFYRCSWLWFQVGIVPTQHSRYRDKLAIVFLRYLYFSISLGYPICYHKDYVTTGSGCFPLPNEVGCLRLEYLLWVCGTYPCRHYHGNLRRNGGEWRRFRSSLYRVFRVKSQYYQQRWLCRSLGAGYCTFPRFLDDHQRWSLRCHWYMRAVGVARHCIPRKWVDRDICRTCVLPFRGMAPSK